MAAEKIADYLSGQLHAPGIAGQRKDSLLHLRFGSFRFQREIFEHITCAMAILDDPLTALRDIDRCLRAARHWQSNLYFSVR